jgi:uncharacterized protein YbjQ (UPF0145 family)
MNPWDKTTMISTTTPAIEGKSIISYHGIVVGEAILGANVFRDIFAGITDLIGGRSGAYEEELGKARTIAITEMEDRARAAGGNAVVGVDLDGQRVGHGGDGGMIRALTSASATGGFCAVFAWGLSEVAPMLTMAQLLGASFVSGFLGNLFARAVMKDRQPKTGGGDGKDA